MRDNKLEWMLRTFNGLDGEEKKTFYNHVRRILGELLPISDHLDDIREARFADGPVCPRCGSDKIKRNGTYDGRQRYLCHSCKRTFNDWTATPMAGTHFPDRWMEYIQLMLEGKTLKKCAEALDISITTAFYWRHKVLHALFKLGDGQKLTGILETDETYFLESYKGKRDLTFRKARKRGGKAAKRGISKEQVAVMAVISRDGSIVCKTSGRGGTTPEKIHDTVGDVLDPKAILVTDAAAAFRKYAEQNGMQHVWVNPNQGIRKQGIYHIQRANGYHSRLKKWMRRFNGVATKYLNHYLYWFRLLEQTKDLGERSRRKKLLLTACRKMDGLTTQAFPMPDAA